MDRMKEIQEKIKLKLIDPPPPKVKISNMMNVLTNEAVADPSKVEMGVKKQIQDRLQKHLEQNQKRKLTNEQKAEKFAKKLKRDAEHEIIIALFRIETL